jgi:quaternary ammonium compound-resistance protein SugE
LGTAYAIWTGIGMVGTFIMGVLLFKEVVTVPQVICVAMIVTGIVGLRLLAN